MLLNRNRQKSYIQYISKEDEMNRDGYEIVLNFDTFSEDRK